MTPARAPAWIRVVIGALGAASFALGLACFVMPARLFGPDAYRTLARVPIGLLGAMAIGVALGAARAMRHATVDAVRTVAVTMFGAAVLVPPVVTFNIGAFGNLTSAARAFMIAALVVAFVSVPLLLSLRVLKRMYRARDPRASRP
ncbi:hypothetical protein WMF20_04620 [Sorangium sp. So ce834]|uniref:hypothetical protein n=1 Tax=Sorangium sp. So ce834 TaxID=3133321 RepID=UPI003F624280